MCLHVLGKIELIFKDFIYLLTGLGEFNEFLKD